MKSHCRYLTLLVAGVLVLAAGNAASADFSPGDAPLVPEKVRQLMQDRDYAGAIEAIDEAAAANDAPKDYLTYLKGRALFLQNEFDRAAAVFDAMQKEFPKSQWLRRARFAKAMALARKGDFRAAELIVRAEADYLLSADRRQQIADIYLEFADALFKPPKEDQKPDYARASEFYQKALEAGPKPQKRIEVELLVAQCQQKLDMHAEAAALYEKFINDHPQSPLDVEARFQLGQCRLAEGNLKYARRAWQDLLAKYVDSQSERIAEAQFQLPHTWRIPKPENDQELNLGVAAMRAFIERFPKHKLASRAYLEIAESFMERGRHDDAVSALRQFLADNHYPDREEIPDARNMLGRCYQLQRKYPEALEAWREYLTKHPAHKAWSDVQRDIIDTEYLMACEKLEARQYDAANKLFAEFLVKYPLDPRSPDILLLMSRKVYAEEKWDEAIANWRRVVSKYPDTDAASLAQFSIADTFERKLGKLEEALEEYRKVTSGESFGDAQQAIARLTATSMTVATERVFRGNETPRLKLVTRNIEAVTVRAYKIDLETYFRKMHLACGVEGLDIALIDPDKTFEFKVPNYAKHQQLESAIEVPLSDNAHAGVMAVTISSKSLEATTLVVQSDLDVIVKSSRDEVFVFAENMLTGKPWADVRLLVSSGQRVFAERMTGKDGVFQESFKELKDISDVRVFAVVGGNVASSAVDLQGIGVAQGVTDKGYIYTDRPVYRAGQTVHVRGCLRRAVNDTYTVEKDKEYTLEVFDNRNRLLRHEAVTLNEFGSFHTHFVLPVSCPQGEYRVLARDEANKNYQGTFLVDEYRLEPVRLVVDTPRNVYYRGEQIEGTIRAAFYHGAPLAGREIRYQLADDRQHTATTDEKGEVHFKLPTREFSETQLLELKAELPEQNVQIVVNYMLSAQAFSIGVSVVRPVFVAGETFETTVNTRDAEGKPVAQKLTLKVLQQTTVNGKVGERLVEEHPLETAAADGSARKTLKLDGGGNYIVRLEGIDRFKNPITGQCPVRISDDEDKVRLRILADAHSYKVGDTAAVTVHWREAPALALVTLQGARVLDYQLVELKSGVNPLSIPMTAKLAPNFDLAVAVMTDKREAETAKGEGRNRTERPVVRFHETSSPFSVQRDLRVKIETKRKADAKGPVLPGEEIEVAVTTTDPQGKPVSAEATLAMVEQSLLDRFGWRIPTIGDFFRAERRESAVRSTSSVTFAYTPVTRPINVRLLAEEDRLEVTAEEAVSLAVMELQRQSELNRRTMGYRFPADDPFSVPAEHRPNEPAAAPGTQADFDSLTELIAGGVRPGTWRTDKSPARSGRGMGGMADSGDKSITMGMASPPGFSADLDIPFLGSAALPSGKTATGLPLAAETAYWNPSIVTDKDGKAAVTFVVPERSTAWKLLAKGITTDTLAGEAAESLVVKKDLFGQLKLPRSFTDGDQAEVIASVCNDAIDKGQIDVTLKTTIGGRSVREKKTIDVESKGIREVAFKVELRKAAGDDGQGSRETADFELTVAAGQQQDVSHCSVPLLPYGVPVFATAAGSATTDTTAWVEPPQGMTLEQPGLSILVGPTVERSLFDALLAPPPECQLEMGRIASHLESATSDLMAGLGLQKLLGTNPDAAAPRAEGLDARIRAAIGLLVSAQDDSGGWSWTGHGGAAVDRYATARVLWTLSLARKAGYLVPDDNFNKAVGFLQKQVAVTADSDYESKAILLHVLSTVSKADFALANRLYRERTRLSAGGLAHLALALVEMDRKPTALELLDLLANCNLDDPASPETTARRTLPWSQSSAELHALWALALQQVAPQSPKAKELVEWLLAHRVGHRWSPDKATGPATLALCQWFGTSRFEAERYTLTVFVNDVRAKVLEVDPAAGTQTIDVPAAMLKGEGKQRVSFQLAGRGRYTYQCILAGFVPADKVKSTTDAWKVKRTYEPGLLEVDGRKVARGFDLLQGHYTTFRNPLTQLPVGQRGLVTLEVWRQRVPDNTPAEQLEYLVVTEPIPSGTTVIEQSVRGGFERFEVSPGAITFYVGNRPRVGPIHYGLHGYLSGSYRAGPTLLRNAFRPEHLAVAAPKTLEVMPLGAKPSDPYRLTPRELFELGKQCFAKGDLKTAATHLAELIGRWNVTPKVYEQAVTTLLDIHLELGPSTQVVRYFEIVKEKWPAKEIPFAKIVKVGAAYDDMGEYERSYLVFRATVESSFLRESGVAGFLEARGQFARGVEVLGRMLAEYPPEGYAAAATYALAQHVYAKAPEAANDPELRKEGINQVDLVRRAWTMLESFLTAYPDDPAADQAAFAAATALLDLKSYEDAAAACNRYAKRFPKSKLLDAYWYVIGYCHFAGGQHKAAIDMCRKVAETKRIDPATGREEESRNKWQAIYILGQVYHSLGEPAEAIREYRRVEDKFPDAKQSIEYFLRKAIELPEVIAVKPSEPAEVELKFRNVAACDLKVYRIDLMKFSLLRRNLGGITQINLAGIRPHHEAVVALGDGNDYRDRTRKLPLPLKEEGAYLVVCRGDDLHASGLVLVTPLAIEVQEDAVAGRVRTTVKDRTADKCLHDVHVKVIGSRNEDFVSGQTDLRGLFVADGIRGVATVIAQAGPSRYAFHRADAAAAQEAVRRLIALQQQSPSAFHAADPSSSTAGSLSGGPGVEKIRKALESPTQLVFEETPLSDVIDFLKNFHGIEIQLDQNAMADVGMDADTPVTQNMRELTLKSALRRMLHELNLTYVIQNEVLLITTPEEAENQLETKVYPVADLVLPAGASTEMPEPPEGGAAYADFDSLIQLLTCTVNPDTWDDVGGPGSIAPFENGLSVVVSQTQEVHEEIEDLLKQMRTVMRETGYKGFPISAPRSNKPSGGGGMGGFGAGMGRFGGATGTSTRGRRNASPSALQQPDLLQGVQEMNKAFQGEQSEKLQKMYRGGQGGVGAGAAF